MVSAVTPTWRPWQQRLDAVIDNNLGEVVEIHPWATGEGFSSGGGPDPNRAILITTAVYVTAGANAVGEISAGVANAKQISQDVWISIQKDVLGTYVPQENDRVYWPYRNEWYQIAWSAPSATERPDIHLLRLNEEALQNLQSHFGGQKLHTRLRGKSVIRLDATSIKRPKRT